MSGDHTHIQKDHNASLLSAESRLAVPWQLFVSELQQWERNLSSVECSCIAAPSEHVQPTACHLVASSSIPHCSWSTWHCRLLLHQQQSSNETGQPALIFTTS